MCAQPHTPAEIYVRDGGVQAAVRPPRDVSEQLSERVLIRGTVNPSRIPPEVLSDRELEFAEHTDYRSVAEVLTPTNGCPFT